MMGSFGSNGSGHNVMKPPSAAPKQVPKKTPVRSHVSTK